ncbi:19547_t:CDS:2, partial [Rhizophagus irregularis]
MDESHNNGLLLQTRKEEHGKKNAEKKKKNQKKEISRKRRIANRHMFGASIRYSDRGGTRKLPSML